MGQREFKSVSGTDCQRCDVSSHVCFPEGIRFAPGVISSEKVGRMREMFRSKFDVRKAKFGSNIQKENEDDGA
jgi:molybdenum cofactor biosynthesis enzyme MoaA